MVTSWCTKITVTVISLFVSSVICWFVAEKYFFNKLFYQKSPLHGYATSGQDWSNIATEKNLSSTMKSRTKETRALFEQHLPPQCEYLDNQLHSKQSKIVIIGDSIVFGQGVRTSQRVGNQLEKILHDRNYPIDSIVTIAQPGDDFIDHAAKIELAEKLYNPVLYIVVLYINDLIEIQDHKYPHQQALFENIKLTCPGELAITHIPENDNSNPIEYYQKYLLPSINRQSTNWSFFIS